MATRKNNKELNADLIGYHLGLLNSEERARVEAAFETPEALAAACARVAKVLSPLDADEVPVPPADLVQGILDRVEEAKNTLPFKATQESVVTEAGQGRRTGHAMLRFRELVGLAAAILLFVGIFMPGYRTARNAAQQAACVRNLGQIGQGYAGYAEFNEQQWPYAGAVSADAPWLQRNAKGAARGANSRHVFTLVRGRIVPAKAFHDPAREMDRPLEETADLDKLRDFPDPRQNSYVTQFVLTPMRRTDANTDTPLAADMTPLVDENRRLLPHEHVTANSNTHGRSRGQNVLHANLSVRYYARPDVGIQKDDIYRLIGVDEYTGLERPSQRSDAFLIP